MTHKQWFKQRGYQLNYNAIHPVWRNRRVYAVSVPLNGGGAWGVFENKEHLERHIKECVRNEKILI